MARPDCGLRPVGSACSTEASLSTAALALCFQPSKKRKFLLPRLQPQTPHTDSHCSPNGKSNSTTKQTRALTGLFADMSWRVQRRGAAAPR
eukprot:3938006-Rhodomonas_salina.3